MKVIRRFLTGPVILLASLLLTPFSAQAVVMTTGCANASSCTLQELYNGGTISINDVLFNNWNEVDNPETLDATQITVAGIDEVVDGGDPTKSTLGLSFIAQSLLTVGGGEELEYVFDFDSAFNPAGRMLTQAMLDLVTWSVVGDSFVEVGGDLNVVAATELEVFEDINGVTDPANYSLASLTSLDAEIAIQVGAFEDDGTASLNQFDYLLQVMRPVQPPTGGVPLPSSLLLLSAGLLGLAGISRKRMKISS